MFYILCCLNVWTNWMTLLGIPFAIFIYYLPKLIYKKQKNSILRNIEIKSSTLYPDTTYPRGPLLCFKEEILRDSKKSGEFVWDITFLNKHPEINYYDTTFWCDTFEINNKYYQEHDNYYKVGEYNKLPLHRPMQNEFSLGNYNLHKHTISVKCNLNHCDGLLLRWGYIKNGKYEQLQELETKDKFISSPISTIPYYSPKFEIVK